MDNLLYLYLKWRPWMLFIIYAVLSCVLLFGSNPYQHSVYLTSANSITAKIYSTSTSITSYFNLRDINEDLQRRNAELELEALRMRQRIQTLEEYELNATTRPDSSLMRYNFIVAHVINSTTSRSHNYITLNKGSIDGVKPEMGVVDQNGVIGKVDVVGKHSSRVISLLNDYFRLSCKVKNSSHVGSLAWDGKDSRYALLLEIPRHSVFNIGDTIVTSGYSTAFPEGVPVGIVEQGMTDYDENFLTARIRLLTDFSKLGMVRLVIDNLSDEIKTVELGSEISTKQI